MVQSKLIFFLGLCLFYSSSSFALEGRVLTENFASKINQIIKSSGIAPKKLGISIGDGFGREVYDHNSGKGFVPASITKILVSATALNRYSSSHRFVTELLIDGSIKKGVLKGNLYLKGGADPSFTPEKLWSLVNELVYSGIQSIEGDIVVDDSLFDSIRFDSGRLSDDTPDRAYNAPVGGMSLNWNSVRIIVKPGEFVGDKARVFTEPASAYASIVNRVKTQSGKKNSIGIKSVDQRKALDSSSLVGEQTHSNTFIVSGNIGVDNKGFSVYRNITEPDYWSGYSLEELLREKGVVVTGNVLTGITPERAKRVASIKGETLLRIVSDMMKFSSNFIAEMLTKIFAVNFSGEGSSPASMKSGLVQIEEFLQEVGVEKENYHLISPSGLSRKNLFRPRDFLKVLSYVQNNWQNFPEFLIAQSVGGVDGTLTNRLEEPETKGWIRAKTGTINGVISLAGFAVKNNGELVPFVFMYNGTKAQHWLARRLFDRLAGVLRE